MIITSKFKDYYDFVAHQYRDNKVVYNRKEIRYKFRDKNIPIPTDLAEARLRLSFNVFKSVSMPIRFESVDAVIIGGKVFQYHHERISDIASETESCKSVFNHKAISEVVKGNNFMGFFRMSQFKQYSWKQYVPKYNDLCIKHGPIIWFCGDDVVVNPCFKDEDHLMNILDPCTMVQTIMASLNSVEPVVPQMDNLTKLEAAGFDAKKSFRHRNKS